MAPNNRSKKQKQAPLKFTIDCSQPVDDSIMDINNFNKYLKEKVKVEGKLDNLSNVKIEADKDKKKIVVEANGIAFSKRYLKYLTKRYLKKNSLREWLRVVADDKQSYTLKYFNINNDEEESDEE